MTKSIGMLLAGEIGPIQTQLALCGLDMGRPVVVVDETRPSADFAGLGPMIHGFLGRHRPPQIRGAAFVVAGPVQDGVCLAANLPWRVEAQAIGTEIGIDRVTVMNDVAAIAHALPALSGSDLLVVSSGTPGVPGNQAILSSGACPGACGLFWNGTEHCPFASEAGHADFAPSNESEALLATRLSTQVPRVTVELLLSTSGLELIYRYFRASSPDREPAALQEGLRHEEPAAAIIREATAGSDPVCRRALDTFLSIYGSAAGNLALTLRSTGGVFLAGSIVPSLQAPLTSGVFQAAFCRKAPMEGLLRSIPVHAIVNDRTALLGAATVAARELRTRRVAGWSS